MANVFMISVESIGCGHEEQEMIIESELIGIELP